MDSVTLPPDAPPAPKFLSPQTVAAELDISAHSARNYMLEMKGVFRLGKHLRIRRLDFERWIARRQDDRAAELARPFTSRPMRSPVHYTMPRTKPRELGEERRTRPIVPRTKPRTPE